MRVKMPIVNDSGEMIRLFKVTSNNEHQVAVLENGQSMDQSDWPETKWRAKPWQEGSTSIMLLDGSEIYEMSYENDEKQV